MDGGSTQISYFVETWIPNIHEHLNIFLGECKFAILHRKIPWRVCVSFFSGLIRRKSRLCWCCEPGSPLWQITGYGVVVGDIDHMEFVLCPGWSPAAKWVVHFRLLMVGLYYLQDVFFCSGMYNHNFAPKHIPPLNVFTDTNHFGGELKNMMPRFCCILMWVRTQELWYLGVKEAPSWDSDSSVFKLCDHVGQNIDI